MTDLSWDESTFDVLSVRVLPPAPELLPSHVPVALETTL
jgi:hypothetical protein